jgi:hypothetical protein
VFARDGQRQLVGVSGQELAKAKEDLCAPRQGGGRPGWLGGVGERDGLVEGS